MGFAVFGCCRTGLFLAASAASIFNISPAERVPSSHLAAASAMHNLLYKTLHFPPLHYALLVLPLAVFHRNMHTAKCHTQRH